MADGRGGNIYVNELLEEECGNAFVDWFLTLPGQRFLDQWIGLDGRYGYNTGLDFEPLYRGWIRGVRDIPDDLWPSISKMYIIVRCLGLFTPVAVTNPINNLPAHALDITIQLEWHYRLFKDQFLAWLGTPPGLAFVEEFGMRNQIVRLRSVGRLLNTDSVPPNLRATMRQLYATARFCEVYSPGSVRPRASIGARHIFQAPDALGAWSNLGLVGGRRARGGRRAHDGRDTLGVLRGPVVLANAQRAAAPPHPVVALPFPPVPPPPAVPPPAVPPPPVAALLFPPVPPPPPAIPPPPFAALPFPPVLPPPAAAEDNREDTTITGETTGLAPPDVADAEGDHRELKEE